MSPQSAGLCQTPNPKWNGVGELSHKQNRWSRNRVWDLAGKGLTSAYELHHATCTLPKLQDRRHRPWPTMGINESVPNDAETMWVSAQDWLHACQWDPLALAISGELGLRPQFAFLIDLYSSRSARNRRSNSSVASSWGGCRASLCIRWRT